MQRYTRKSVLEIVLEMEIKLSSLSFLTFILLRAFSRTLRRGLGWVSRANLPHVNHRFCAVADEMNDLIYMIGGYHSHAYYQARQYKVSTNAWSTMPVDSNLNYIAKVTIFISSCA